MASIFLRFPQGKAKALTLSYDDGVEQDIRLIEIMRENGLKGTFNISSGLYAKEGTVYEKGRIHRIMTEAQAAELYKINAMEVAAHGLHHAYLNHLPENLCTYEVLVDRINLEREYECMVRGLAYPYGVYNDKIVEIVKHCGIAYARIVGTTESFELPNDWLRWKPTCHHNNPRLMELAKSFVEDQRDRAPMLYFLYGHSYEFERDNNWEIIEAFAKFVGNREDIWYAANGEIYEYVNAFHQLIFSGDGSKVRNPTAIDLYFKYNGKHFCVRANETIVFAEVPG